MNHKRKL